MFASRSAVHLRTLGWLGTVGVEGEAAQPPPSHASGRFSPVTAGVRADALGPMLKHDAVKTVLAAPDKIAAPKVLRHISAAK